MTFVQTSHPATPSQPVINDGFFPDLDLSRFRNLMRVETTVTDERARQHVIIAIRRINGDLADLKAQLQADGYGTLIASDPTRLDGETTVMHDYEDAVFSRAKALIMESYRDVDISKTGESRAQATDLSLYEYMARSLDAITRILGRPRATVELI